MISVTTKSPNQDRVALMMLMLLMLLPMQLTLLRLLLLPMLLMRLLLMLRLDCLEEGQHMQLDRPEPYEKEPSET